MTSEHRVQRICTKMSTTLSSLGSGEACGARWTLGALLLAPLAAANSSYCAVPAVILLAVFMTIATLICKDLKKLSEILPPPKTSRGRRERNLRSFADFMAMWMAFLSHLVAVAICARILSATADHVTGGRTRRWLFGYETKALGEPWPDVMGVTVVMVVCAMFMCGLEESIMFTFMLLILLYIFSQFFAIVGLMNLDIANINMPIPITIYELFAAGAPICYAFSVVLPPKENGYLKKNLLLRVIMPAIVLSGLCFLYTNMLKGSSIDAALPVMTLLEARSAGWVCPVLAAVTVAGVCLALTELCPLLFNVLVALASPEWKVLTRSMTYESATTGSPVLAVFTAGSLAAILAFACPLSHMITLMNASHLLGIVVQAFHFIILRCVPTAEQKEAGDVEYKRLGTESALRSKSTGSKGKRGLWFIPSAIRHTKTLESIKSKVTAKGLPEAKNKWLFICNGNTTTVPYSQRQWDEPLCERTLQAMVEGFDNLVDRARFFAGSERESGLWLNAYPFFNIETEERECLLLDEYAGCPTEEVDPITSCSSRLREVPTAEMEDVGSDVEASEPDLSSGDDSTDIDAVVKEYRDRIQVVTAIPEASTPAPPCVRGARWAAAGAVVQVIADALIAVAFCNEALRLPMFAAGIPLWICGTFTSVWQPAHNLGIRKAQSLQGPIAMLTALLFLTPLLLDSWPAITLFAAAGVVIYARCERWCGDLAVQQARTAIERRKLRPMAGAVPLTGARLAHIDTVYIAR